MFELHQSATNKPIPFLTTANEKASNSVELRGRGSGWRSAAMDDRDPFVGCAFAAGGAVCGAVGHSVLIYFLSGIFRNWGQREGIDEGIFIITVVPAGAVLGALTVITICLWQSNSKASAARWSFFGGSILTAAFVVYGVLSIWGRGYLQSFGPAGLWSISLTVFGLTGIITRGDCDA